MTTFTFATVNAMTCFEHMAYGMHETRHEDGDPSAAAFLELAELVWAAPGKVASIPPHLVQMARTVLENCLDVSSGRTPKDDPGRHQWLFDVDVKVAE